MFISGIKSLEVEWREVRALNGLDLKVYVLIRNFPGRLTCREIARLLGAPKRQVWLSLLRLTDRFYVRHDSQGRYEKMQFFHFRHHNKSIERPRYGLRKILRRPICKIFKKFRNGTFQHKVKKHVSA